MWSIFKKEFNAFLNSLIAYVVLCVFLTGTGLIMWVFPETNVLNYGFADMTTFFVYTPFVFLFLIPAITMRTFAEEKKAGTLEWLLTKPVSNTSVVLGKYFACLLLVVVALVPTLLYYFSLRQLGNPVANIDTAAVAGSYVGLLLLAAAFTAVGVLSSALTENQIIAFIMAVFVCYFFYSGFDSLAAIDVWGSSSLFLSQLGMQYHFNTLSKGLIDSRDVLYFISLVVIALAATRLALLSYKR